MFFFFNKRNSGVALLHSVDELGIEYTRGCTKNMQYDVYHWRRCDEPIHTGINTMLFNNVHKYFSLITQ